MSWMTRCFSRKQSTPVIFRAEESSCCGLPGKITKTSTVRWTSMKESPSRIWLSSRFLVLLHRFTAVVEQTCWQSIPCRHWLQVLLTQYVQQLLEHGHEPIASSHSWARHDAQNNVRRQQQVADSWFRPRRVRRAVVARPSCGVLVHR